MPTNVPIPNLTVFFSTFRKNAKFYVVSSLPDSGANRSIFHPDTLHQNGMMTCTGFILLRICHGDDPRGLNEIIINALVSPSMKEAAILCYNDLIRLQVLPKQFPAILTSSRPEAACTKVSAAAGDSIEKIIADFRDIFDSTTLTPVKGDPMTIVINRETPGYKPL